jgi:hypothetical protein
VAKPHPGHLTGVIGSQVEPSRSIMIGDSDIDLRRPRRPVLAILAVSATALRLDGFCARGRDRPRAPMHAAALSPAARLAS